MSGITIDKSVTDFAQTFGVLALLVLMLIPATTIALGVLGRALLRQINVSADAISRTGKAIDAMTRRLEKLDDAHADRFDQIDQSLRELAARVDAMPADVRRELDPIFTLLNQALDRIEKKRQTPTWAARLFGMERLQ